MIDTIVFLISILVLFIFLVLAFTRRFKLAKPKNILFLLINLALIILLFLFTGTSKIKHDLSRFIENSSPKKAEEVYALLFKKPADGCLSIINFKDQVIPQLDCCIWMEVKLCPAELVRIINAKKYQSTKWSRTDSIAILSFFPGRPAWWSPQVLGDSLTKMNFKFDKDNEQTLFFSKDSSHLFLCDQAL